MRAIVLSGGGSKGSYQIGVWKALKKLNIKYDIITGTSVGALNGVLMVEKNYYKCKWMWNKVNMRLLFNDNIKDNEKNSKLIKNYGINFLKTNGTKPTGLENILNKVINKNKFFKSKIKYGLISYNITEKKPIIKTKDELSKQNLIDYLIASSSCYPAFTPKIIDNKKYIDGGYYDNLPINLAINLGADEIIAIDLEAPGIKKRPKKTKNIMYITPNNKLSFFLKFNKKLTKRNELFGYNDTMKVFNKLEGNKYTFKLNTIQKLLNNYKNNYIKNINKIIDKKITIILKENQTIKKVINEKHKEKIILNILELLMKELALDETKIYNIHSIKRNLKHNTKIILTQEEKNNTLIMYKYMINKNYKSIKKIAIISPLDFLKAMLLYTILGDKNGK